MSTPIRYFLRSQLVRANLIEHIRGLQVDTVRPLVIEIKEATRSLEQNNKMWAVLTDISHQVNWYGRKLSPESWKHVLTAALEKQDVVPGIDGGFVALGKSTSQMTVRQMCDLIELAHAFGAQQGVKFGTDAISAINEVMAREEKSNQRRKALAG